MDGRGLLRSAGTAVVLVGLVAMAFCAGALLRGVAGTTPDMAFADDGAATVSNRTAEVDGAQVGEVLINDDVVMRLRATVGGMAPGERAMIVAGRLQTWLAEPAGYDLSVLEMEDGTAAISAGAVTIVTVVPGDAEPIDSTALDLANDWRNLIYIALGMEPAPVEEPGTVEGTVDESGEWVPSEPYRDKIVPILSVLSGIRVGAARVNGPESRVRLVQAVAQVEGDFRGVLEIDVYVPISTRVPGSSLQRVQGVGVTALGDLRL